MVLEMGERTENISVSESAKSSKAMDGRLRLVCSKRFHSVDTGKIIWNDRSGLTRTLTENQTRGHSTAFAED